MDLRVLLNRNFGLGSLLIGLFGAVIYGIIALLPLFYQTLMGYTASSAGLAVSPRGIGAVLIMPLIGVLTSKIDNRFLIASGFCTFGFMSLWFGSLNLQMSQWSLTWPIIISGAAAGMVFIPLSTTAMGTLSNQQMGNASGIYNLLRNIGGSLGISLQSTLVARHGQLHRAEMINRISSSNPVFESLYAKMQSLLLMRQGPGLATKRTYGLVQHTLDQQAALWSYVDNFRYLALGCFACVPVVFLLKKVVARRGATSAAH
jgi:DHA2 family multidrug resistance protein